MSSRVNAKDPPRPSIRRWLFTTNHKDIGLLYFGASLYFLLVGGVLGFAIRAQLAVPDNALLAAGPFNQAVTLHGLIMVLWFLSPLAFGFANYLVPLQIGARDLAFPRVNALSFWLFLFGGLLAAVGFFTPGGAIATGWTVYAPLNTAKFTPALGTVLGAAGLIMLVASVTVSTINFIVTILRSRAPGLKLLRMPMFTWSILFTVILMLLAFPALAAGLVLLAADRILGTVYFSSTEGGALLWTHVFWFFGHPEVYIVLLPGLGAVAEVLPAFARRPLYGKKIIIGSLIAATALSLVVWVHHMFLTGVNPDLRKFMTITTEVISIPFGIIVISFVMTAIGGVVRLKTPMLFALGAILLFIVGGVTGVFNSSVALDFGLRGTYWIVGHFHYTLVGGAVTGMIAALYYWWPKMTGRMYSERLGKTTFVLYLVGFNLAYFPMLLMLDMPRRVTDYAPALGPLNFISTIGTVIFGASILLLFATLFHSLRRGSVADKNPWDASGLEWMVDSPPPMHNFDATPIFTPQGLVQIGGGGTRLNGGGVGIHHEVGREKGVPETHESPWPLFIGLGTFLTLLGLGFFFLGLGLFVLVGGLVVFSGAFIGWARDDLREKFVALESAAGERWPFEQIGRVKLAVWVFLASEIMLFGTLIGGYLFVRLMSATWPASGEILNVQNGAVLTFVLLTSGMTAMLALGALRSGRVVALRATLIATFALGLSFLVIKGTEWVALFSEGFDFTAGLPGSTFFTTTGVHGAHVAGGLIVLLYLIVKSFRGRYSAEKFGGVEYFALYWGFVDIVWLFLFPLFYLF
ncbi:MAG: cbb3-type cytochrome c oxidase subunit I [Dehalococcoidia bacterium]